MHPLALMGLSLIVWELSVRRSGSALLEKLRAIRRGFQPTLGQVRACLALLVFSFAAQLTALYSQAHAESSDNWTGPLPVAVMYDGLPFHGSHVPLSILAFSLTILQPLALFVIAIGYARKASRARSFEFAAAVAAIAGLAIAIPLVTTPDIFEYIQCGVLQFACYAPPAGWAVPGYLTLVASHIHLHGSIYGPLWVAVNSVVALAGDSLLLKILAVRLYGALVVLGTAALLAKTSVPRSAVVAFIANPFVWLYFVMDAHVDMQAFALIVAASLAAARRKPAVAALLLAGAALVKLPFVVLGSVALSSVRSAPRKIALWLFALGLTLAVSYALGGMPYFHALLGYNGRLGALMTPGDIAMTKFLQGITATALVLALFFGRRFAGQLWIFPTGVSAVGLPWYISWGFPYALEMGSAFTVALVALPPWAAMLDQNYELSRAADVVALTACAVIVLDRFVSLKNAGRTSAEAL
jgi:hypothetical protein